MKAVSEHMDQVIDGEPETEIVDENLYYGKRFTDKRFEKLHRQILEYRKEVIANSNDYSEAQKQYQDWMRPAYLEVHGGSGKSAEEHLAEDITLYKKQYKDLTARVLAASVTHVDLQI